MNVAMSRAKELLIIIGNSETLQEDDNWNEVLQKAELLRMAA